MIQFYIMTEFENIDRAKVGKFQRRLAVTAALGPFTDAFNEFGASISLIAVGIIQIFT